MQRSKIIHSMILSVTLAGIACAGGTRLRGEATALASSDDLQTQSSATTVQSFTAVGGADTGQLILSTFVQA